MSIEQIKNDAAHLSGTVLAEPWAVSEKKVKTLLGNFHQLVSQFAKAIPAQVDEAEIEEILGGIKTTIARISDALHRSDLLAISNALAGDMMKVLDLLATVNMRHSN